MLGTDNACVGLDSLASWHTAVAIGSDWFYRLCENFEIMSTLPNSGIILSFCLLRMMRL